MAGCGVDLRRSSIGTVWAVNWFPGVPCGSPHDLAQDWHGPFVLASDEGHPSSVTPREDSSGSSVRRPRVASPYPHKAGGARLGWREPC